jgi:hypothetical protein
LASGLAELLGAINRHDHGRVNFHVLEVVKLFFGFGVPFKDKALHSAIFLADPLLDQLLHQEMVDQFIFKERVFHFAAVDGVPPDLFGNEDAGGDVDEVVFLGQFFAESSPATEGSPNDDDLRAGSGDALNRMNRESLL